MNATIKNLTLILFLTALFASCTSSQSDVPNTLSDSEKEAGWKLLFDGKTTNGWRNYKKTDISPNWKVVDGTLHNATKAGDIVAIKEYQDFELKLEWKTAELDHGNSGIFIRASELGPKVYHSASEMQILNNKPNTKMNVSAGANYALHAPEKDVSKPVGEWNSVHIIAKGKHIQFFLNDFKTADFVVDSPDWIERFNKSKFKKWKDKGDDYNYGRNPKGFISLQDHGDLAWFRNIKIKELN